MSEIATANEEAVEAWNGVLFDRFVQYRPLVVDGLAPHGDAALSRHPPQPGDRVLDIGCGFGDTAQQIARIVGPQGSVLGVDAAERFIETAIAEAPEAGTGNVRFVAADLQAKRFDEQFDYAFSRFGTMFFASPVAALRNVREALVPGGPLCMVVWRGKADNPWLHVAEQAVKPLVEPDENSDEPTCGPGPFSMADDETVLGILEAAGFADGRCERCDLPYRIGRDLSEAVEYNMALGPAAEAIRLAGEQAQSVLPQIEESLRAALTPYVVADGSVVADASTWIVTAHAP